MEVGGGEMMRQTIGIERKHPLQFVADKGVLAQALGISPNDLVMKKIEATVDRAFAENWNLRQLLTGVGEMDITDEMWAVFLYTYGWFDGRRRP